MPDSEITRITGTTANGFLSKNLQPKYKYIEDPADVVSLTYKNQFSQFNVKYHELKVIASPIFGRFSGERVVFQYDWDTVVVSTENNSVYVLFLRAGTSPESVQRFCLNFLYSSDAERILREHRMNDDELSITSKVERVPAPLTVQCLRSVVINMERMPKKELQYLPSPYRELFVPDSFIPVKFNLWPRHVFGKGESTILMVKKEMIISEVLLLLRQKLELKNDLDVCLFRRSLPVEEDEVIMDGNVYYDCVVSPSHSPTAIASAVQLEKHHGNIRASPNKEVIIASLVGRGMKELQINLSLPLRYLDIQLRQMFRLKPWSFLVLYLPSEGRTIFHAGRMIYSSYEEEFAKFLVSNGKRNFPKPDRGMETLGVKDMYKECSAFKKSLRNHGFRPGILVEVFEVTGPSVPVMYSGAVTKAQVLDVNPDWSLQTFLYYVKVNTPQASKIESIDYVRDYKNGKMTDILNMMKNLWNRPDQGGRLEYVRLRS